MSKKNRTICIAVHMLVTDSEPSYQLHTLILYFRFLPRSEQFDETLKLFNLLTANERMGNSRKLPKTNKLYVALYVHDDLIRWCEQTKIRKHKKMRGRFLNWMCLLSLIIQFPEMSFRPEKLSTEYWNALVIDSSSFCAWMKIKLNLNNIFLGSFCINSTKSYKVNAEHNVKTSIRLNRLLS